MLAQDFSFSMDPSGSGQPPGLLRALVAHALGLTRGQDEVSTVLAEFDRAMASVAGDGRRPRLEVKTENDQMEIVIVSNRESIWCITRSLA